MLPKKVLVLGEFKDEHVRHVSFEAIAAGRKLAADGEVVAVLVGENVQDKSDLFFHYGADRVVVVEHSQLKHYTPDGFTQALLSVIEEEKPEVIVFGHTALGKDLSPKIANRLNLGLVSDVIQIEEENGEYLFTRPIYSGKAFEKVMITDDILFITIRPNNISPLEKDTTRKGTVTSVVVEIGELPVKVKEVIRKSSSGVDLSEAKVVVAGGRGVKSKEGFRILEELADLLGGAVGASRGACDANYCDYSLQIGQTGKVVTPDVYIACGISGAIQHLAGMSNSKMIIAINKDPDADIFKVCDYGIVGDLFEVVPQLIEELKNKN